MPMVVYTEEELIDASNKAEAEGAARAAEARDSYRMQLENMTAAWRRFSLQMRIYPEGHFPEHVYGMMKLFDENELAWAEKVLGRETQS